MHVTNPHVAEKIAGETDYSKYFRPFDDLAVSVAVLHGHERGEKIIACLKRNMANAMLHTVYVWTHSFLIGLSHWSNDSIHIIERFVHCVQIAL